MCPHLDAQNGVILFLDHSKAILNSIGLRKRVSEEINELDRALARRGRIGNEHYLGCIVTTDGCSPNPKKRQGLAQMKEPKNKCQVRKFLGGINFRRKIYSRRSRTMAPLPALTGNIPFTWTNECQKAFDIVLQNTTSSDM